MNADFVRLIDSIHREKGIDTEDLFLAFEEALITTIRKKHDVDEDFTLTFDRVTGEVQSEYEIDFEELGRIFAQTVKQTFYTKIKEAERDVLFNEYEEELETVVTGQIQRFEGENVIVSLGKVDGVIPRSEKVRGESYHPGERIRALIHEVKKLGLRVKIILSRASNKLVQRLFELEVPEIADGVIEVRKLEREPGYRTKIAVSSSDPRVDCVGACVGVRGTRIKAIIDELNGERIDIIRWSEDPETMLRNALQPAEVVQVTLDDSMHSALVLVEEDQLSLAIGRKGQNVRLASKLTGWDIDIMTRKELEETLMRDAQDEVSTQVYEELTPILIEQDSMFEVRFCVTINDHTALVLEYGLGDSDPEPEDVQQFQETLAGLQTLQGREFSWCLEMNIEGKRDDAGNAQRVLSLPEGIDLDIQAPQRGQHRPLRLRGSEEAIRDWIAERENDLPRLREILLRWKLDLQLPTPKEEELAEVDAEAGQAGQIEDSTDSEAPDSETEPSTGTDLEETNDVATESEEAPERHYRAQAPASDAESVGGETPDTQEASAASDSNDENKPQP
ncbi:MAG: transcription termination factor NusA [Planctomycetota bacterium]|nr:MAG: transcription termination factor NusA [Planctomycetota bacterium]